MPRFRQGERVQLTGDIARFYACIVGVVIGEGAYPASVLNQYNVRLADGSEALFFDFQLESPSAITGRVIFDRAGLPSERQIHLVARDIDICLSLTGSAKKAIAGKVTVDGRPIKNGLVTLLKQNRTVDSTTIGGGEFALNDTGCGEMTLEIFVPSRRILANLRV